MNRPSDAICSPPLCPHQGTKDKVAILEKKLAELEAEGKPVGAVLKPLIQSLCSEEVGFFFSMSRKTPETSFSLTAVRSALSLRCFVALSETAARPRAQAAAREGDGDPRLHQPHESVLSPRRGGGGAQPEEGNVSGAGRTGT